MSRIEIEHLLEQAIAEALGVRIEQPVPRLHYLPGNVLKSPRKTRSAVRLA